MELSDRMSIIFQKISKNNILLSESLEIINSNCVGNVWLIGSTLYKGIASALYKGSQPKVDLDFIIEKETDISLPKGWELSRNRYGNFKFISGEKNIDFVPIANIHSIKRRRLQPNIKNYLSGTPLSIQSIAYDLKNEQVIGNIGIQALTDKKVLINNLNEAIYAAEMKELTLDQYINKIAKSLDFESVVSK